METRKNKELRMHVRHVRKPSADSTTQTPPLIRHASFDSFSSETSCDAVEPVIKLCNADTIESESMDVARETVSSVFIETNDTDTAEAYATPCGDTDSAESDTALSEDFFSLFEWEDGGDYASINFRLSNIMQKNMNILAVDWQLMKCALEFVKKKKQNDSSECDKKQVFQPIIDHDDIMNVIDVHHPLNNNDESGDYDVEVGPGNGVDIANRGIVNKSCVDAEEICLTCGGNDNTADERIVDQNSTENRSLIDQKSERAGKSKLIADRGVPDGKGGGDGKNNTVYSMIEELCSHFKNNTLKLNNEDVETDHAELSFSSHESQACVDNDDVADYESDASILVQPLPPLIDILSTAFKPDDDHPVLNLFKMLQLPDFDPSVAYESIIKKMIVSVADMDFRKDNLIQLDFRKGFLKEFLKNPKNLEEPELSPFKLFKQQDVVKIRVDHHFNEFFTFCSCENCLAYREITSKTIIEQFKASDMVIMLLEALLKVYTPLIINGTAFYKFEQLLEKNNVIYWLTCGYFSEIRVDQLDFIYDEKLSDNMVFMLFSSILMANNSMLLLQILSYHIELVIKAHYEGFMEKVNEESGTDRAEHMLEYMLDGFDQLSAISQYVSSFFFAFDRYFLKRFGLTWSLLCQRLYQQHVYKVLNDTMVNCILDLKEEEWTPNRVELFKRFLDFDDRMVYVERRWYEIWKKLNKFNLGKNESERRNCLRYIYRIFDTLANDAAAFSLELKDDCDFSDLQCPENKELAWQNLMAYTKSKWADCNLEPPNILVITEGCKNCGGEVELHEKECQCLSCSIAGGPLLNRLDPGFCIRCMCKLFGGTKPQSKVRTFCVTEDFRQRIETAIAVHSQPLETLSGEFTQTIPNTASCINRFDKYNFQNLNPEYHIAWALFHHLSDRRTYPYSTIDEKYFCNKCCRMLSCQLARKIINNEIDRCFSLMLVDNFQPIVMCHEELREVLENIADYNQKMVPSQNPKMFPETHNSITKIYWIFVMSVYASYFIDFKCRPENANNPTCDKCVQNLDNLIIVNKDIQLNFKKFVGNDHDKKFELFMRALKSSANSKNSEPNSAIMPIRHMIDSKLELVLETHAENIFRTFHENLKVKIPAANKTEVSTEHDLPQPTVLAPAGTLVATVEATAQAKKLTKEQLRKCCGEHEAGELCKETHKKRIKRPECSHTRVYETRERLRKKLIGRAPPKMSIEQVQQQQRPITGLQQQQQQKASQSTEQQQQMQQRVPQAQQQLSQQVLQQRIAAQRLQQQQQKQQSQLQQTMLRMPQPQPGMQQHQLHTLQQQQIQQKQLHQLQQQQLQNHAPHHSTQGLQRLPIGNQQQIQRTPPHLQQHQLSHHLQQPQPTHLLPQQQQTQHIQLTPPRLQQPQYAIRQHSPQCIQQRQISPRMIQTTQMSAQSTQSMQFSQQQLQGMQRLPQRMQLPQQQGQPSSQPIRIQLKPMQQRMPEPQQFQRTPQLQAPQRMQPLQLPANMQLHQPPPQFRMQMQPMPQLVPLQLMQCPKFQPQQAQQQTVQKNVENNSISQQQPPTLKAAASKVVTNGKDATGQPKQDSLKCLSTLCNRISEFDETEEYPPSPDNNSMANLSDSKNVTSCTSNCSMENPVAIENKNQPQLNQTTEGTPINPQYDDLNIKMIQPKIIAVPVVKQTLSDMSGGVMINEELPPAYETLSIKSEENEPPPPVTETEVNVQEWINEKLMFIEGSQKQPKVKPVSSTSGKKMQPQTANPKKAAKKAKQKLRREEEKRIEELHGLRAEYHETYFKEFTAKHTLKQMKGDKKRDKKKVAELEIAVKRFQRNKSHLEAVILEQIGLVKQANPEFKFSYLPTKEQQVQKLKELNMDSSTGDGGSSSSKPHIICNEEIVKANETNFVSSSPNIASPVTMQPMSFTQIAPGMALSMAMPMAAGPMPSGNFTVAHGGFGMQFGHPPAFAQYSIPFPGQPQPFQMTSIPPDVMAAMAANAAIINQGADASKGIVTIRRVPAPNAAESQVTVTAKGTSPENDKVLYTLTNGQIVDSSNVLHTAAGAVPNQLLQMPMALQHPQMAQMQMRPMPMPMLATMTPPPSIIQPPTEDRPPEPHENSLNRELTSCQDNVAADQSVKPRLMSRAQLKKERKRQAKLAATQKTVEIEEETEAQKSENLLEQFHREFERRKIEMVQFAKDHGMEIEGELPHATVTSEVRTKTVNIKLSQKLIKASKMPLEELRLPAETEVHVLQSAESISQKSKKKKKKTKQKSTEASSDEILFAPALSVAPISTQPLPRDNSIKSISPGNSDSITPRSQITTRDNSESTCDPAEDNAAMTNTRSTQTKKLTKKQGKKEKQLQKRQEKEKRQQKHKQKKEEATFETVAQSKLDRKPSDGKDPKKERKKRQRVVDSGQFDNNPFKFLHSIQDTGSEWDEEEDDKSTSTVVDEMEDENASDAGLVMTEEIVFSKTKNKQSKDNSTTKIQTNNKSQRQQDNKKQQHPLSVSEKSSGNLKTSNKQQIKQNATVVENKTQSRSAVTAKKSVSEISTKSCNQALQKQQRSDQKLSQKPIMTSIYNQNQAQQSAVNNAKRNTTPAVKLAAAAANTRPNTAYYKPDDAIPIGKRCSEKIALPPPIEKPSKRTQKQSQRAKKATLKQQQNAVANEWLSGIPDNMGYFDPNEVSKDSNLAQEMEGLRITQERSTTQQIQQKTSINNCWGPHLESNAVSHLTHPYAAVAASATNKPLNPSANISIMDQLNRGVQVENLALPPGITLTKVDPAKSEQLRQKSESIKRIAKPLEQQQPSYAYGNAPSATIIAPPVSSRYFGGTTSVGNGASLNCISSVDNSSGIIMVEANPSSAKLITSDMSTATANGSKISKNKKKRQKSKLESGNKDDVKVESANSSEHSSNSDQQKPKMITLRNPMFHGGPAGAAASILQQQPNLIPGRPVGGMSMPTPLPPDQPAAIIKNENGMFTIRNPALHQAVTNGMGLSGYRQFAGNINYYTPQEAAAEAARATQKQKSKTKKDTEEESFSYFSNSYDNAQQPSSTCSASPRNNMHNNISISCTSVNDDSPSEKNVDNLGRSGLIGDAAVIARPQSRQKCISAIGSEMKSKAELQKKGIEFSNWNELGSNAKTLKDLYQETNCYPKGYNPFSATISSDSNTTRMNPTVGSGCINMNQPTYASTYYNGPNCCPSHHSCDDESPPPTLTGYTSHYLDGIPNTGVIRYDDASILKNLIPGQSLNNEVSIHNVADSNFVRSNVSPVAHHVEIRPVFNNRSTSASIFENLSQSSQPTSVQPQQSFLTEQPQQRQQSNNVVTFGEKFSDYSTESSVFQQSNLLTLATPGGGGSTRAASSELGISDIEAYETCMRYDHSSPPADGNNLVRSGINDFSTSKTPPTQRVASQRSSPLSEDAIMETFVQRMNALQISAIVPKEQVGQMNGDGLHNTGMVGGSSSSKSSGSANSGGCDSYSSGAGGDGNPTSQWW